MKICYLCENKMSGEFLNLTEARTQERGLVPGAKAENLGTGFTQNIRV